MGAGMSSSADLGADATDAVAAAMAAPAGSATMVMPADISWRTVAGTQARPRPLPPQGSVPAETIEAVRQVLMTGEPVTLLLGGRALRERGLRAAASIAAATGSKLLAETFPARLERGGDLPPIQRLNYLGEMAIVDLAEVRHLVLVGTPAPASFFAYPDQVSELWPQGCQLHVLAGPEHDLVGALESLAEAVSPAWALEISARRAAQGQRFEKSSDRTPHLTEHGDRHSQRASRGCRGGRRVQLGGNVSCLEPQPDRLATTCSPTAAARSGWASPWPQGRPSAPLTVL